MLSWFLFLSLWIPRSLRDCKVRVVFCCWFLNSYKCVPLSFHYSLVGLLNFLITLEGRQASRSAWLGGMQALVVGHLVHSQLHCFLAVWPCLSPSSLSLNFLIGKMVILLVLVSWVIVWSALDQHFTTEHSVMMDISVSALSAVVFFLFLTLSLEYNCFTTLC